jgi:hypothetical protein
MAMPRISRRIAASKRFIRTPKRRPKAFESTLGRTIGLGRLGGHRFPVSTPGAARKSEQIFVIGAAAIVNGSPHCAGNL